MNLDELNKHIEKQTLPMLKDQVGIVVKEVVASAVKEALKDGGDGKSAKEKELEGIIAGLQSKAREASGTKDDKGRTRTKGEGLGAIIRCLHKARNDYDTAANLLKRDGHSDLAELVKAECKQVSGDDNMSKAMTAGDPETGGILIPQAVSGEIIDILRARVIVRRLGAISLPMPNGNFRLPKKTASSQGYYVGESTSPTISGVKHGSVLLTFKKLVTVVPSSNDLFRYSSPGADMIIRNDIVDGTAVREDQAFLRDIGTDATPKGIRYWAAPGNVFNATGSTGGDTNLGAMTDTLGNLVLRLIQNNVPMINPAWIMSPRTYIDLTTVRTTNGPYAFRDEMMRGTLWGWPFVFSTSVPNTLTEGSSSDCSELYLVDMADVVIGDAERLIIDASGEAAYEEGGSVKAAFTRDETVIRAISEHDIVVRRAESVAVAKGLRWGA